MDGRRTVEKSHRNANLEQKDRNSCVKVKILFAYTRECWCQYLTVGTQSIPTCRISSHAADVHSMAYTSPNVVPLRPLTNDTLALAMPLKSSRGRWNSHETWIFNWQLINYYKVMNIIIPALSTIILSICVSAALPGSNRSLWSPLFTCLSLLVSVVFLVSAGLPGLCWSLWSPWSLLVSLASPGLCWSLLVSLVSGGLPGLWWSPWSLLVSVVSEGSAQLAVRLLQNSNDHLIIFSLHIRSCSGMS